MCVFFFLFRTLKSTGSFKLRLVHTYDASVSISTRKSACKPGRRKHKRKQKKNGPFSLNSFLCLCRYVVFANRDYASTSTRQDKHIKHKHKRNGSMFFSGQTNKCIQSHSDSAPKMATEIEETHCACACACVCPCAYEYLTRVNVLVLLCLRRTCM